MNKQTIITILFALVAMAGLGQVKCHVVGTVADTYGIAAIPRIILFAPDGTILANGLRGEEIEKKLEEIFRDK